jgi:hypothetical protein
MARFTCVGAMQSDACEGRVTRGAPLLRAPAAPGIGQDNGVQGRFPLHPRLPFQQSQPATPARCRVPTLLAAHLVAPHLVGCTPFARESVGTAFQAGGPQGLAAAIHLGWSKQGCGIEVAIHVQAYARQNKTCAARFAHGRARRTHDIQLKANVGDERGFQGMQGRGRDTQTKGTCKPRRRRQRQTLDGPGAIQTLGCCHQT